MDSGENESTGADGAAPDVLGGSGRGGRGSDGGAAEAPAAVPAAEPAAGEALDPTMVAQHSYLGGARTCGCLAALEVELLGLANKIRPAAC